MKHGALLCQVITFLLISNLNGSAQENIDADSLAGYMSMVGRLKYNHPDSAIALFQIGIQRAINLNDVHYERIGNAGIGITYGIQGDYAKSMEYFDKSLAVSIRANEPGWIAGDYSNKGIIYKYLGDFDKSLDEYFKALTIYDSIGDPSGMATTYHNLGILYDVTNELDRSLEYYLKSKEIGKQIGEEKLNLLTNMGILKRRMGDYEGALEMLTEYLDTVSKTGNASAMSSAHLNVGNTYIGLGRLDEAEYHSKKSLDLANELESYRSKTESSINMALIYEKRGMPNAALLWRKDQLKYAKETQSMEEISIAERALAKAYQAVGQNKNGYEHLLNYTTLRDSLFQSEKNNAYKQWQTRLDVFGKDQEIKSQDLKLELLNSRMRSAARLRLALAISLGLALLSGFLFYQRSRLRKKANELLTAKNKEIESQKLEIEVINRELEKRMLRAQINPHFIFNSLNSIQHFITIDEKLSALKYLSKFSKLLRQSLENSVSVNVPLVEEIQLLKTYLELESLRFDHSFTFSIECDDDLDIYEAEVPILLVQPFIENAVLHGFPMKTMDKGEQKKLFIRFSEDVDHIICTIRDNGIGRAAAGKMKDESISKRPSRGISVTEQRLSLLYPKDIGADAVTIHDLTDMEGNPSGTEVVVKIPKD